MKKQKVGSISVICGPMYSGKTEELIRRIRRANYSKQKVHVFKHAIDDRYDAQCVTSHLGDKVEATLIQDHRQLLENILPDTKVIAIDEVQFFAIEIVSLLLELRNQGYDIIAAGLDLDFRGVPFGPMPYLLALADEIIKLRAVCAKTGKEAQYSQRLIDGRPAHHTDPVILVGASDSYQARSKEAFEIDYIPLKEYLSLEQKR
jgi:thymidine kinase